MIVVKITKIVIATLSVVPIIAAHSWIEEYQVIDSNGSYIGDKGYARGYVARTDPAFTGPSMTYLIPQEGDRINSTDLLCHPGQRTSNYSNPAYPKLKVQPGGYVAMKYLENGHVTLPWNQRGKPTAAGTVFVYGTTQPSPHERILDVLRWTADGTGGDGRGVLLTAQNFDDGRCHQINCGNLSIARQIAFPDHVAGQPTSSVEQWCETDLRIPVDQPAGRSLTIYWLWQWATQPDQDCTYPDGKDEYYSTCADFDIVDENAAALMAAPATNTLVQQDPQTTAVATFAHRAAFTTSPHIIMVRGTQTVGQTLAADRAFVSMCASTTQPAMADVVTFPAECPAVSSFNGAPLSSAVEALKEFRTTGAVPAAHPTEVRAVTASAGVRSSSEAVVGFGASFSSTSSSPSAAASMSQPPFVGSVVTVTSLTTMTTSVTTTMVVDFISSPSSSCFASSSSIPTDPVPSAIPLRFETLSTIFSSGPPPPSSSASTVACPASITTPTRPSSNAREITTEFVTVTRTRQQQSPHSSASPPPSSFPASSSNTPQAAVVPVGTDIAGELQEEAGPTIRRRGRRRRQRR